MELPCELCGDVGPKYTYSPKFCWYCGFKFGPSARPITAKVDGLPRKVHKSCAKMKAACYYKEEDFHVASTD